MPQYKVVNGVKIAVDASVKIYVNGRLAAELVTNPEDLEDLAIGYLYSEGYINALDDIVEVKVDGDAIYAKLKRDVPVVGRRLEDCGVGTLVKSLAGKSLVSPELIRTSPCTPARFTSTGSGWRCTTPADTAAW
jgi:FdhD protein